MGYLTVAGGMTRDRRRLRPRAHDPRRSRHRYARTRDSRGPGARRRRRRILPLLNAQLMRAYMQKYGARPEDFAPFAVTAHRNALTIRMRCCARRSTATTTWPRGSSSDPIRLFDASPICNGVSRNRARVRRRGRDPSPQPAGAHRGLRSRDGPARARAPCRPAALGRRGHRHAGR